VARERIRVIHPGIDSTCYTPAAGLDRTPAPTFLYVGRLKRYKGVEVALRALAAVRQQLDDVTLDIAGSGDDRHRLEGMARRLGIADAVRFHGLVTESKKRELFQAAWANILPSPKEGWGLTVMEAAACGTPSLASDSPGLRDSVRDGLTGFLVPHGNAEALARRMLEFAEDRSLVTRLGAAARAHAKAWSWDDAAGATESHLEALVAE
jgi:glycosyltransferase involved in cell wall biosynthesis